MKFSPVRLKPPTPPGKTQSYDLCWKVV